MDAEYVNPYRSPNGLIPVRLLVATAGLNGGEIGGFSVEVAADLVQRGLAEYYTPAGAEPQPSAAKPPVSPVPPKVPEAKGPEVDTATHELNIDDVGTLAESITDLAKLEALIAGEKLHPKHPDGRKGALELLDLRAAELQPSAT